jgi:hypothetical protein
VQDRKHIHEGRCVVGPVPNVVPEHPQCLVSDARIDLRRKNGLAAMKSRRPRRSFSNSATRYHRSSLVAKCARCLSKSRRAFAPRRTAKVTPFDRPGGAPPLF